MSKESSSEKRKNLLSLPLGRLTAIALITTGSISLYSYLSTNIREIQIQELTYFVENHDQQEGLSLEDALNFGKRANIPKDKIREQYSKGNFSLKNYPTSKIQAALNSYKHR